MHDVNYLDEISKFIFTSKSARYDEKLGRRETWEETITRVENMHLNRYVFLSKEDKKEIKAAFDLVKQKRIVPSMRSLQFGGKAIEAKNPRMYNCLDKNTQFITNEGVKSFNDFEENQEITVLTHKGNWKKAIVKKYGEDYLNKITISKGKHEIDEILATSDHRWFLRDGSITQSLKEGDNLMACPEVFSQFVYNEADPLERLYWCYGYIFGDGTKVKNSKGEHKFSMVRLCDHASRFFSRFEEMGFKTSSPLSCDGDFIAYTGKYLKTAPDPKIDSPNLIRAFVKGYLDADGARNTNYTLEDLDNSKEGNAYISIQSSNQDHINFIRKCFPIAGVYIISETNYTGQKTNLGVRPYTISFRIAQSDISNSVYRVKKIETNYKHDEVWCLEVEDDNSFVLLNGTVTGNCCVRHIDSLRSFSELFFLLLCGCGVGIGLSKKYLSRLPDLVDESDKTGIVLTYAVEDTMEGWANSVEALLNCYFKNTPYTGRKIIFDYSKIRKKGSPLKTGGGKAPGHLGLKKAHKLIKELLDEAIENKHQFRLKSIDAYDILMHCADATLSGGVRRSATCTVFQKDDNDMLEAKISIKVDKVFAFNKDGNFDEGKVQIKGKKYEVIIEDWELEQLKKDHLINWWHIHPQRARSNNSVLLLRNNTTIEEFKKIIEHTKQFGEPGFVFADHEDTLFNPCFEISFIPVTPDGRCGVQFCNLTSMNGRAADTKEKFFENIRAYTIIGTLQAGYTNFPFLSQASTELTKEEALLGCSITGCMDNSDILLNSNIQKEGAQIAKEVNETWAKKIGINPAARITCIKPEGTTSLIFGTGSGIHPHHSKKYFRRVQCNKMDSVYKFFKKNNPSLCEPSVWSANHTDDVVTFLVEAPEKAIIKNDLSAIQHLEIIKSTQINWVLEGTTKYNKKSLNHNVSCTVITKPDEWPEVIKYVYENRKYFTAISFISSSGDKDFAQAPMEALSTQKDEEKWNELKANFKSVDYTLLQEDDDNTNLTGEVACGGGACENKV